MSQFRHLVHRDSEVYLTPSSSTEAQRNLKKTVVQGGISLRSLRSSLEESQRTLEADIREKRSELDDLETDLTDREEELQSVKSEIAKLAAEVASDTRRQNADSRERRPSSDANATQKNELAHLKNRRRDLENRVGELREAVDRAEVEFERLKNRWESLESRTETEIERLREVSSDDRQVRLWGIRETIEDRWEFEKGDVLLFYTGNYRYALAGIVGGTVKAPLTGETVLEHEQDGSYPLLLVFDAVVRIDVNSAVVATLADHEIDYVFGFTRLNDDGRRALEQEFGGLDGFLEAARAGIEFEDLSQETAETPDAEASPVEATTSAGTVVSGESADSGRAGRPTTDRPDQSGGGQSATEGVAEPSTPTDDPSATDEDRVEHGDGVGDEDRVEDEDEDEERAGESVDVGPGLDFASAARQLEQNGQLVVYGPPGTGKAASVRRFARHWLDDERSDLPLADRIETTAFHPDLDDATFVEGEGTGSSSLVTGPFGEFCDLAAADSVQAHHRDADRPPKYVLVVRNFHAADALSVFGETWPLLDPAMRGPDHAIRLSSSRTPFWVPEELYVVGIVDTSETTIGSLPGAVRKRFRFYHAAPRYEPLREAYGYDAESELEAAAGDELEATAILALVRLNQLLRADDEVPDGCQVGQLFLSASRSEVQPYDESGLRDAWLHDVLPQVAAYYDRGLGGVCETLLAEYPTAELRSRGLSTGDAQDPLRELLDALAADAT